MRLRVSPDLLHYLGPQLLIPDLMMLHMNQIQILTMRRYLHAVIMMCSTLRIACLLNLSPKVLDSQAAQLLQIAYQHGIYSGLVPSPMAGILWLTPTLSGTMRQALPKALKAASGWKRLEPASSRLPVPY